MASRQFLRTYDPEILGATVKDILDNPNIQQPLCMHYLLDCISKLPFSIHMYYNKIEGLYIVSNMHPETWTKESFFCGVNFTVVDFTLESGAARAIHYYYHYEKRKPKCNTPL